MPLLPILNQQSRWTTVTKVIKRILNVFNDLNPNGVSLTNKLEPSAQDISNSVNPTGYNIYLT